MQLRDCKPGMRLRLIDKAGGAADVGAIAVVAETSSYDDKYVNVNWDRTNGLDHGQMNGQYRPESFEEIKPMTTKFKKGDKFTVTFTVTKDFDPTASVEVHARPDQVGAVTAGVNYISKNADFKDIVRVPVPLAAGQVWVKEGLETLTLVYVDDKTILYERPDGRRSTKITEDYLRSSRTLKD